MKKITLAAEVFKVFHDEILQKFEMDCKRRDLLISSSVGEKYGFKKSEYISLQEHIKQDKDFKIFCDNNNDIATKNKTNIGKYLYGKFRDANNKRIITLSGEIYTVGLFRYLGYNDFNHFLSYSERLKKNEYLDSLQEQKDMIDEKGEGGEKETFTNYVGYLCSTKLDSEDNRRNRGILTYSLKIEYDREQRKETTNRGNARTFYYAEMQINHSVYTGIFFTGTAILCLGNLTVELTSNEDRHFNFMFATGAIFPKRRSMLKGVYMTISGVGGIVGSETIMIKRKTNTDKTALALLQYFRSNHFQIRVKQDYYIKDLNNPKDGSIALIDLIGIYYWLYIDRAGNVTVNKLTIENDLSSHFLKRHSIALSHYTAFIEVHSHFLHIQLDKDLDRGENRGHTVSYAIFYWCYPENLEEPYIKGEQVFSGRDSSTKSKVALVKAKSEFIDDYIGVLDTETLQVLVEKEHQFKKALFYVLGMEEKDKKRYAKIEEERQKYVELLK